MADGEVIAPADLEFTVDPDGRVTRTSDEDRALVASLTVSQSKRYEETVGRIMSERLLHGERQNNTHLIGLVSGRKRQIDVLLTAALMDGITTKVVVECKLYSRRIGIGTVDEFFGKLSDVGAQHGVLCAPNGFDAGARARAESSQHPTILLLDLSADVDIDLSDLPGPDCPAFGCEWGWVRWSRGTSDAGESIGIGRCGNCGSIAVQCDVCGYKLAADEVDECECGYRFKADYWHDGSEWVVRSRNSSEDEDEDEDEGVQFNWGVPELAAYDGDAGL